MASSAFGSDTSSSASTDSNQRINPVEISATVEQTGSMEQRRPQAGPLPVKAPRLVGEIGYSEGVGADAMDDVDLNDGPNNDDPGNSTGDLNAAEADALNGRHPADRSHVNLAEAGQPATSIFPPSSLPHSPTGQHPGASTETLTSQLSKLSFRSLSSRLSAKKYGGISLNTLCRLGLLLFILGGLIVAWVFASRHVFNSPVSSPNGPPSSGTSTIFIHVTFVILTLLLLVFVERTIFRLRAERYAHIHPGQVLPSHRHSHFRGMSSNTRMGFAPWNRPSLPTYAAALGVRGTGDVEDAVIAAPPPPAYGNTRGSTLLLASFLRNSLRSSVRSHRSMNGSGSRSGSGPEGLSPGGGRLSRTSTRSMPVSYEEAEHQSDVERARILEEALAKLEDNASSSRR